MSAPTPEPVDRPKPGQAGLDEAKKRFGEGYSPHTANTRPADPGHADHRKR